MHNLKRPYSPVMGSIIQAPTADKNVSRVVEVVHRLGIGRKVARLEPVAVIKG